MYRHWKCPDCDYRGTSEKFLDYHKKMRHEKQELLFECEMCDKKFPLKGQLNVHVNRKHLRIVLEKRFPCTQCDRSFVYKANLYEHTISVHTPNPTQLLCHLCPRTYVTKNKLNMHISKSHGPKTFKCTYEGCTKAFVANRKLKIHMLIHNDLKKYQCPKCSLSSNHINFIKRHNEAHHLGWRYTCVYPGCDLEYMHKKDITKHLSLHHTKDPAELEKYKNLLTERKHHVVQVETVQVNGKFDGRARKR